MSILRIMKLKRYQYIISVFIIFVWLGICTGKSNKVAVMVITRIDLIDIDKNYGDCNVTLSKISKTDFAVNVNAIFYKDLPEKVYIHIHFFALYSNTYRKMSAEENQEICTFIAKWLPYLGHISFKDVKFPLSCPFKAGHYYLRNYIYDASKAPLIPWKNILTKIRLYTEENKTLALCHVYVENNQEYINLLDKIKM